jgi:hypothetical protein
MHRLENGSSEGACGAFNAATISTLPLRVGPLSWEDLPSLLSRVAEQMGYHSPTWITAPQEIPYAIRTLSLLLLNKQADYLLLGRLLSLSEDDIYGLTLLNCMGYS